MSNPVPEGALVRLKNHRTLEFELRGAFAKVIGHYTFAGKTRYFLAVRPNGGTISHIARTDFSVIAPREVPDPS